MESAIRLEVLKMAKELLQDKFYSERDCMQTNWDNTRDSDGRVPTDLVHPLFPSDDDIIDTAEELYKFIKSN